MQSQFNTYDRKQLENFTKFARMITKRLNVQVVFESASAKADNQNTIYLPTIIGMTSRDVEFLYGITLHEAGHIRFTNYQADNVKIKSSYHFRLLNAIEDARIENLLINDFDGAHDMFLQLYNDFAADHKYMERVFGFDPKMCDIWYFLGIYLHQYLVHLSKKPALSKVYNKSIANKVEKLVKSLQLESVLQNAKLETWQDAYDLATIVYDKVVKHVKDNSEKPDIQSAEKTKNVIERKLQSSREKIEQYSNEIDEYGKEISKLKPKYDEVRIERSRKLRQAERDYVAASRQVAQCQKQLKKSERARKVHQEAAKAKSKMLEYQSKLNNLQDTKRTLENQLNKLQANTREHEKAAKKLDNTNRKITDRENQILKQERLHSQRKALADRLDFDSSHIEKQLKNWEDKKDEARKRVVEHSELTNIEQQYENLIEKLEKAQANIHKELLGNLQNVENMMQENGMPEMEGMPKFEESIDWPESDAAQQEFDDMASKESGKVVKNGRELPIGNGREILAMIDNSIQDVKDFNVLEHFAESNTDNKLKNFNDINNIVEYVEETKTTQTNEKHIALTTQYDRTVYRENADSSVVDGIKKQHANFINQLKRIFSLKLKFNRRDRFKSNQDEGKLDSRSLWKIAANIDDDNRVFEKIVHKFINKNIATIMNDISGSMDKSFTLHGQRLRELSVFLSEALNEVFIDHQVIGTHAPVCHEMRDLKASSIYNRRSNLLETVVYKKFDNKNNKGLANIEVECADNSDGEHLRLVAQTMIKRGGKTKLLFYITDGKPFLSDCNLDILDSDLYRTVEWLKKQNIKLFVFGFNAEPKKFFKDNYCQVKEYSDILEFLNKKL